MEHLSSIIESLLFVRCEPMSVGELAAITGDTEEAIAVALQALEKEYTSRGLTLVRVGEQVQLGSSPTYASFVEKMVKYKFTEALSRSALETLAVIAYKGPLSRAQIEFIRGVNSSFALRNLLMRGLVERMENLNDTRTHSYRVSADFLKHFGLTKMEALPQFAEFQKHDAAEIFESSTIEADREE